MSKFWTFETVDGSLLVATEAVRAIGPSEREDCTVKVWIGQQAFHGVGSLELAQAEFMKAHAGGEEA